MTNISFVNMKGGVAKTTLAVNVADALRSRHDAKVLIVDLDPQFNATQCLVSGEDYVNKRKAGEHTVYNIFDDTPAPISAVSGSKSLPRLKLENIKPWKIKDGLDLIPGDLELHRLEMASGQGREHRLKRYLDAIKADKIYDYVIIDTPPTPSAWMTSALLASDYYLIPVKPEPLSITGIDLLKGVIQRCVDNYGITIECLGVVLTIAEDTTVVFRESVAWLDSSDAWKGKLFKAHLPKRVAVARAQSAQGLILDDDKTINIRANLVAITQEFVERSSV